MGVLSKEFKNEFAELGKNRRKMKPNELLQACLRFYTNKRFKICHDYLYKKIIYFLDQAKPLASHGGPLPAGPLSYI